MINRYTWRTPAAVGPTGTGDAEAEAESVHLAGRVVAVRVTYSQGAAATTDFYLRDRAMGEDIVVLAADNTDVVLYPRRGVEFNDGEPVLVYDDGDGVELPWVEPYIVHGPLVAIVDDADDDDFVAVDVWIER